MTLAPRGRVFLEGWGRDSLPGGQGYRSSLLKHCPWIWDMLKEPGTFSKTQSEWHKCYFSTTLPDSKHVPFLLSKYVTCFVRAGTGTVDMLLIGHILLLGQLNCSLAVVFIATLEGIQWIGCHKCKQHWLISSIKNPAYGRQRISRPMRIVGPIQFLRGRMIYLKEKERKK